MNTTKILSVLFYTLFLRSALRLKYFYHLRRSSESLNVCMWVGWSCNPRSESKSLWRKTKPSDSRKIISWRMWCNEESLKVSAVAQKHLLFDGGNKEITSHVIHTNTTPEHCIFVDYYFLRHVSVVNSTTSRWRIQVRKSKVCYSTGLPITPRS